MTDPLEPVGGSNNASGSDPGPAQKRESERLLAIWKNASRRHVSLGSACGCGIGGVTLAVQDYEQDIVDYLLAQAEKHTRDDVVDFLDHYGRRRYSDAWDLTELLGNLARQTIPQAEKSSEPIAQEPIPEFLLQRLARTLSSFIQQHD
jgi:hypothetical protein